MRCFNATQSVRLLLTVESGARITKITWDGIRDQADRYLACSVKRAQLNRGDADMVAKAIRNVASNIQPEMNRFVEAAEIFLSTSDR